MRFYFDSNELESAEFKIVLIRFGFDWALSAKRKVKGKKKCTRAKQERRIWHEFNSNLGEIFRSEWQIY